jgi:uncharacterized protein
MLIEFKVTNFRSIRDTQSISLVAGTAKERREENTFDSGIPGFSKLVRSAVIYGANAAGKTNLLLALQFMQSVIVSSASLQDGMRISYMPFRLAENAASNPSSFEIALIDGGVRYEYGFSMDADRVHEEWLIAYPQGRPQKWFERNYDTKTRQYVWYLSTKLKGNARVWRDATRDNALFLSVATQLNSDQLRPIFTWFQKKLVIVGVGPSFFNQGLTFKLFDDENGKQKLLRFIHAADFGIADMSISKEPMALANPSPAITPSADNIPAIIRVTSIHKSIDTGKPISFDLGEESNGTQILFKSAGAWLNVLENGEVLFVDELDTSLHPHMTRFLVKLFHDHATNKHNAQLVFTTHDTSLLDPDLFRRDQVWFVEKDEKSASCVYPLTDFSPRKDEALERGYLRGRYGALPFIGELRV